MTSRMPASLVLSALASSRTSGGLPSLSRKARGRVEIRPHPTTEERGVGREAHAAICVEAQRRLDQPQTGDLQQVPVGVAGVRDPLEDVVQQVLVAGLCAHLRYVTGRRLSCAFACCSPSWRPHDLPRVASCSRRAGSSRDTTFRRRSTISRPARRSLGMTTSILARPAEGIISCVPTAQARSWGRGYRARSGTPA